MMFTKLASASILSLASFAAADTSADLTVSHNNLRNNSHNDRALQASIACIVGGAATGQTFSDCCPGPKPDDGVCTLLWCVDVDDISIRDNCQCALIETACEQVTPLAAFVPDAGIVEMCTSAASCCASGGGGEDATAENGAWDTCMADAIANGDFTKPDFGKIIPGGVPDINALLAAGDADADADGTTTTAATTTAAAETDPIVCPDGQDPIPDTFCGRGPDRVECGDGELCFVDPTDRFAVCCPAMLVDVGVDFQAPNATTAATTTAGATTAATTTDVTTAAAATDETTAAATTTDVAADDTTAAPVESTKAASSTAAATTTATVDATTEDSTAVPKNQSGATEAPGSSVDPLASLTCLRDPAIPPFADCCPGPDGGICTMLSCLDLDNLSIRNTCTCDQIEPACTALAPVAGMVPGFADMCAAADTCCEDETDNAGWNACMKDKADMGDFTIPDIGALLPNLPKLDADGNVITATTSTVPVVTATTPATKAPDGSKEPDSSAGKYAVEVGMYVIGSSLAMLFV